MSTIRLEIVTPERKVYSEDVDMIIVKGELGELGILPKHAPLVTPLVISAVRIKKDGKEQLIAISGGFLEVSSDKAVILAETAELPEEIDINRALAAKERAEQRLSNSGAEEYDFKRAQLALQRALNRIRVAERR
ncbi:F0F1 ATP synthase subunit epsilon [Vulcanibacillus modesticaldus]|uniref:ATP synthase epsilon chain n=1 Tax=Vulcanibacillus modesticaldus TaxID=337097 RepID=A0A1D2YVS6_9BACI|nr:F0F1 ATP synthase subunit epsilon [Vulcanibacillus modesticaldus]OEF99828.1 F0F1 ATP synthase subunit epsilon [Vulcanibacillus modesticaldus]